MGISREEGGGAKFETLRPMCCVHIFPMVFISSLGLQSIGEGGAGFLPLGHPLRQTDHEIDCLKEPSKQGYSPRDRNPTRPTAHGPNNVVFVVLSLYFRRLTRPIWPTRPTIFVLHQFPSFCRSRGPSRTFFF